MRSKVLSFGLGAAVAAVGAATTLAPAVAHACGGFFCQSVQMDQAGENILFASEPDGSMTTHVQILYQGVADRFAWILPVPTLPEISIGTDELFRQVGVATDPRFSLEYRTEGTCREEPSCPHDDWTYPPSYESGGTADAAVGYADAGPSRVDVLLSEAVGPYDAVVLSSGDAEALLTWLRDNGYDIPDVSLPLIMEYVTSGHYFLALKLQQDRGTGEIAPVVLHYRETQPCVPIKLTAIATVPDMPIRAYVLGAARAVPANYRATEVDLDHVEFWTGGASYTEAVSRAADEAGGRAFVTDYAGPPPSVSLELPSIEDLRTTTDAGDFLRGLRDRNFTGDSQLLAILMRFLPPPDGVEARDFYNCLFGGFCPPEYTDHIAALGFDPSLLVDALNEAIVDPRHDAQALLARHGKLTRLFTTMSADEMTEDPVFDFAPSLPDVSNVHTATQVTHCGPDYFSWDAPRSIILPSGREENVFDGIAYRGSDAQYCSDVGDGLYGRYVDVMVRTDTAARRSHRLGGGGGCATTAPAPFASVAGLASAMAIASLARLRRRRKID